LRVTVDARSFDAVSETDSLLDRLRSISVTDVFDEPADEPPKTSAQSHYGAPPMGVQYAGAQYGRLTAPYAQMGLPSAGQYGGGHYDYQSPSTNWAPQPQQALANYHSSVSRLSLLARSLQPLANLLSAARSGRAGEGYGSYYRNQ